MVGVKGWVWIFTWFFFSVKKISLKLYFVLSAFSPFVFHSVHWLANFHQIQGVCCQICTYFRFWQKGEREVKTWWFNFKTISLPNTMEYWFLPSRHREMILASNFIPKCVLLLFSVCMRAKGIFYFFCPHNPPREKRDLRNSSTHIWSVFVGIKKENSTDK